MRWHSDHVEWGEYTTPSGETDYAYYFFFMPNRLGVGHRSVGLERMWYDGPHTALNFWWFNVSWCTRWSRGPNDYWRTRERPPSWWMRPFRLVGDALEGLNDRTSEYHNRVRKDADKVNDDV